MAEDRFIIMMSFSTREERDEYKRNMKHSIDKNVSVDSIAMRSSIQSGTMTRYRIWEWGFWKEVFKPYTHRWAHTEYDND